MCFSKKSSAAQPQPAPAPVVQANPNNVADNSNDAQVRAQRLAATQPATGAYGSELGTPTLNQPNPQAPGV